MTSAPAISQTRSTNPVSPTASRSIHKQIEIDRADFFRHAGEVTTYRAYADGEQALKMTQGQKEQLENLLEHPYCDNVCHQIIAEDADRIILQGFAVKGDPLQSFLQDVWTTNNLTALSSEVAYEALQDGNYALMVAWDYDRQKVRLYKEPWWDGKTGVYIAYDAQGDALYAVKDWMTLEGLRRTIWRDGFIERYLAAGGIGGGGIGQFAPYTLPEDNGIWPVEYNSQTDFTRQMHIPLIHFANAGKRIKNYGKSELSGGVLAHQDHINDLQFDMTGNGRMTGFQMIWMAGVTTKTDSRGNPVPPRIGAGKVFWSKDPQARFGTLPPGPMQSLIDGYTIKLKAVARMTRTPLHVITGGDWPSGEALDRAEMPLVNKVTRQIEWFKAAWQEVMHRATEIANAFSPGLDLDENEPITAKFADPSKRNPTAVAMADQAFWAAAKAAVDAGLPLEMFLERVAGWTDEEIKKVKTLRDTAYQDQIAISGKTAESKAHGQMVGTIKAKKESGVAVNPSLPPATDANQQPPAANNAPAANTAGTQPTK